MKAVKLECFQATANYRKPSSFQLKETFPLPPYSTVIGMVHAACGFLHYVPMKVAVQGTYCSTVSDVYTRYELMNFDSSRHTFGLADNGNDYDLCAYNKKMLPGDWESWAKYGINRGTGYVETLVDVKLVLHICPEDEAMATVIQKHLQQPQSYLSLGRHEDLLCCESIRLVDIEMRKLREVMQLENDAYIPQEYLCRFINKPKGTMYKLNKVYCIDEKSGLRRWQKPVFAVYAAQGSRLNKNMELPLDEEGQVAFLI